MPKIPSDLPTSQQSSIRDTKLAVPFDTKVPELELESKQFTGFLKKPQNKLTTDDKANFVQLLKVLKDSESLIREFHPELTGFLKIIDQLVINNGIPLEKTEPYSPIGQLLAIRALAYVREQDPQMHLKILQVANGKDLKFTVSNDNENPRLLLIGTPKNRFPIFIHDESGSMSGSSNTNWARILYELRQYRDVQKQTWGDINDATIAVYLAGEGTPEQNAQVESAMERYPAVREAIEIVKEVLKS